jgi:uncharacterized protein YdhG (YjbR/CyaY superfamily)
LEHLRGLIQTAAPDAAERIGWGMLVYDEGSELFAALAAQKHYVGLYVSPRAMADMSDELRGIDHGKSCLRFKRLEKVPTETIAKLLAYARVLKGLG